MPNSFFSPVRSIESSGNSFYSPIQGDFGTFDIFAPTNGTVRAYTSLDATKVFTDIAHTTNVTVTGAAKCVKDVVTGAFVPSTAGAASGLYTAAGDSSDGKPYVTMGGFNNKTVFQEYPSTPLNTSLGFTLLATIKNLETSVVAAYAAIIGSLGNESRTSLYNTFIDPAAIQLTVEGGTGYKNGAASPLTLDATSWIVVQADFPAGFLEEGITIGGNRSDNFYGYFQWRDILFIQDALGGPSVTGGAKTRRDGYYATIRARAGL